MVFTQAASTEQLDAGTMERYLRLLNVRARTPSLPALNELVSAHLTRVPFENISKLYYRKQLGLTFLLDIHRSLDGIEKFHFGAASRRGGHV